MEVCLCNHAEMWLQSVGHAEVHVARDVMVRHWASGCQCFDRLRHLHLQVLIILRQRELDDERAADCRQLLSHR